MVSHKAQPEGPTARVYNYVLGGFEKKKKKKRRLATDVSSGANLKKKNKAIYLPNYSRKKEIVHRAKDRKEKKIKGA